MLWAGEMLTDTLLIVQLLGSYWPEHFRHSGILVHKTFEPDSVITATVPGSIVQRTPDP